jgi:DNA-binding MurR/RpiR family transcriptional regulator
MALLEVMDECNGKSILVTDLLNSKMHALATQVLTVRRGPMDTFRPLGPVTALIDAMILGLMRKKGEEAVQGLRRLDDLRQRYQVLYK